MPRTKIAQPNHAAASPPRARRGRSATKAVKEHAKQGKIAKVFEKVKPGAHADEVYAACSLAKK